MRIALLTAEYPPAPGGVGDYCARLAQTLSADQQPSLEIAVLRSYQGALHVLEIGKAGQQSAASFGRSAGWGWSIWQSIPAALRSWKPDILHIQYQTGAYGMHPAINLLPALLRRTGPRPALVLTMHDLLLPYLAPKAGWLREWVTYRLMADCDALIVTNHDDLLRVRGQQHTAQPANALPIYRAQRPLPAQLPIAMIPIGTNIEVAPPTDYHRETWRQGLGYSPQTVLLSYFGLISPGKGLDTILDALEQLPEHIRLLVIGGEATAAQDRAYAEALHRRIQTSSLQQRVQVTGHCPAQEVSAHLLASDIAVLPFTDGASFRRGSLLAALAHGLPVITTQPARSSNEGPQLVDGRNAVLIPAQNATALAAAVNNLVAQPEQRRMLAQAAQQLAAYFSWKDIAQQHMRLYAQLTSL